MGLKCAARTVAVPRWPLSASAAGSYPHGIQASGRAVLYSSSVHISTYTFGEPIDH